MFTSFSGDAILRPMMLSIRPMTEADLDAVLAIEEACFPKGWSRGHFLAELSSERACCVVAELKATIVGYLCLSVLLDEAEILNLAVDPAFQGRGIGRQLVQWGCDQAVRRGARQLLLEVRATSHSAIKLYEQFGFVRNGLRKAYYENGIDAVLMNKNLIEEECERHAV